VKEVGGPTTVTVEGSAGAGGRLDLGLNAGAGARLDPSWWWSGGGAGGRSGGGRAQWGGVASG
jgi:hypothetical protein